MDTMTSRVAKIITGSFLIWLTMSSASHIMGYEMLYALAALPIIFSGIFDWRPVEWAVFWIARSISLKESGYIHTARSV